MRRGLSIEQIVYERAVKAEFFEMTGLKAEENYSKYEAFKELAEARMRFRERVESDKGENT